MPDKNITPNNYESKDTENIHHRYLFDYPARDSIRIQLYSYHIQRVVELHQLEWGS
jgi:hypothetical protein